MKNAAEAATLRAMVALACRKDHRQEGPAPCPDCSRLLEYALARLARCPHGPPKPACRDCPTHCYAPGPREAIRHVMRTAGPWMLMHHPVLALRHLTGITRPPASPSSDPP